MTIRAYKPKGSTIRALKFDGNNAEEVRDWCFGRIKEVPVGDASSETVVMVPTLDGVLEIHVGEYLCWTKQNGFSIKTASDFEDTYDLVKNPRSDAS